MSVANIAYLTLVITGFVTFAVVLCTTHIITNLPPRKPAARPPAPPSRAEEHADRQEAA